MLVPRAELLWLMCLVNGQHLENRHTRLSQTPVYCQDRNFPHLATADNFIGNLLRDTSHASQEIQA